MCAALPAAGTLPPSYGRLTKLRQLGLWGNRLRGPLPAAWSGMAALQTLDLSVNALTGEPCLTWLCVVWGGGGKA